MDLVNHKIPKPVIVKNIEQNAYNIKTFTLESYTNEIKYEDILPGKFCNIWIPNRDMKPFSISGVEDHSLQVTIKKIGKITSYIHTKLKIGDKIGLMGPLGNGFMIQGKNILLIGGGFGIAPLKFLLTELVKQNLMTVGLLGFKSDSDMFFTDYFRQYTKKLYITTEDGCVGEKGYCTDILDSIFRDTPFDQIYCCGPEPMMYKVLQFSLNKNVNAQFSLERYFGCGIGLCGKCYLNGKFRVCIDGPIINSLKLKELTDFGKYKLDRTGKKIKI
ncbi:MAG: dihydroorotate dehydrogenase electron transfer subunit [Candidatus Helarchaeota archaeon]